MHLGKLHEEVEKIRRMALEDRTGVFVKRSDSPLYKYEYYTTLSLSNDTG
jgi:hypothetical protein